VVDFPFEKGLTICKEIRRKNPKLKILIFSSLDHSKINSELYVAGANSFLQKDVGFDTLKHALKELDRVGRYYHYDFTELLKYNKKKRSTNFIPTFSAKELLIVHIARKELTNKEVAEKLKLNIKTIEMHKHNIIEKTDSKKIISAINYLLVNDIIPLV
jgi:DNA-binding NarL/FixJ family response regulator